MSNLVADQLHRWVRELSEEIEALERTWLEVRRMKSNPRYLARADSLEEALDLMRSVRTEFLFELYGTSKRRKTEAGAK